MNDTGGSDSPLGDLLDQLVGAQDDAGRQVLIQHHPKLSEAAAVAALCDRSARQLRVDVADAERSARAACWLAQEVADSFSIGRSLRTMANVLHVHGDYAEAVARYEEALKRFDESGNELEAAITRNSGLQVLAYLGRYEEVREWADEARRVFDREGDRLRSARLRVNLGAIAYRQERLGEALELFETAYRQLLEVGSPEDVAVCLRDLATLLVSSHDLQRAEEVYSEARDYCRRSGLLVMEVEVDYNIAYLYYLRGEYTRAIDLYRATREKCDATGEAYHRALCDLDESEIYLELNLVQEQSRTAEAACLAFERLGMAYEQAKALTLVALGKIRQHRYVLGLETLDRARRIFAGEQNRVWLGIVDLYKALTLAREGRRIEAGQLARKARRSLEAEGLTSRVAVCRLLEASLALAAGELGRARRACWSALELLGALDRPDLEYQAHFLLGRAEEASERYREAFEAYLRARVGLESLRSRLPAEELKIGMMEDRLEVYESLVAVLAEERVPEASPSAVFACVEQAKARSISELLAFRGLAPPQQTPARSAQVERVRRLREELSWCQRRIGMPELAGEKLSLQGLSELQEASRRHEEELAATLRDLERTDREFTSLQGAVAGSLDEVHNALPAGTLLLEYYFVRDSVYVCVVGQELLEVVPVSLVARVRELQAELGSELAKVQAGCGRDARPPDRSLATAEAVLRQLYEELLGPVAPHLQASQLVVVPHRFLHDLPFHALHDGEQYLGQRYAISYAPSAHVLCMCHARPTSAARGQLVLSATGTGGGSREANRELSEALAGGEPLRTREASLENLRSGSQDCCRLHLSVGASYRQDNPMFSTLELTDGRLSLFELFGLRLQAEIVTLSGAGKDLRDLTDGYAWVGLARGLLYAGARCALLPLWNGPEAATDGLLAGFYRGLSAGAPPALALQQAMTEIRKVNPHPYQWASFALVGSPRPAG